MSKQQIAKREFSEDEFDSEDEGPDRRADKEHPEQAYRRGYQQGAQHVIDAL